MWQRQVWRPLQRCLLASRLHQHQQHHLSTGALASTRFHSSCIAPLSWMHQQARHFAVKARKPKKDKMKSYTSMKHRFKLLPDGTFARAQAGKRHNASSKTKKQRRQLRKAALVHPGYARIIRKLGFKDKA